MLIRLVNFYIKLMKLFSVSAGKTSTSACSKTEVLCFLYIQLHKIPIILIFYLKLLNI